MEKFDKGAFTKYVRFWGGGGQRFVTNLCKNIGICTVLRYEGGGGGLKYLNTALRIL